MRGWIVGLGVSLSVFAPPHVVAQCEHQLEVAQQHVGHLRTLRDHYETVIAVLRTNVAGLERKLAEAGQKTQEQSQKPEGGQEKPAEGAR
jgi:hypothetical protein